MPCNLAKPQQMWKALCGVHQDLWGSGCLEVTFQARSQELGVSLAYMRPAVSFSCGESLPSDSPSPLSPHTVKEKLRLDPDSEIATTGVRVSLICPVSPSCPQLCGWSLWDSSVLTPFCLLSSW